MKKLLLASTALVATAGFAAADVALTGSAEMGIKREAGNDVTEFHTDVDVRFTMSGESDNGISFGAVVDLEDAAQMGGTNTDTNVDYNVFISAGAATLTMGDTDGAFDAALDEVNVAGGSIADDETAHAGFSGNGGPVAITAGAAAVGLDLNGDGDITDAGETLAAAVPFAISTSMGLDGGQDGQVARFDYAFSGATASLSVEVPDTDDGSDPVWGIGVNWSGDLSGLTLGVGVGYQAQNDVGNVAGLSLKTTFSNGIVAAVNFSRYNDDGGALPDHSHAAIGLGYSAGALAIGVNYGVYTLNEDFGAMDSGETLSSGFGLAASYDLGGGLSAHLGYGSSSINDDATPAGFDDDFDSISLGLAMAF
ncbi:porin [Primorskyibacter sp. S187A]|uniref:porin n=1 Tax=Primorskyibacter sp. S187A TaxID=3415130 RepID=UPI003C7B7A32